MFIRNAISLDLSFPCPNSDMLCSSVWVNLVPFCLCIHNVGYDIAHSGLCCEDAKMAMIWWQLSICRWNETPGILCILQKVKATNSVHHGLLQNTLKTHINDFCISKLYIPITFLPHSSQHLCPCGSHLRELVRCMELPSVELIQGL